MNNPKVKREKYFSNFFREFRASLRTEDQPIVDKLVKDLVSISMEIPPKNKQYSFREVLMLTALIIQKKIDKS